jgi:tripartite-type tricarboxylate transporter receptor subunit TctC
MKPHKFLTFTFNYFCKAAVVLLISTIQLSGWAQNYPSHVIQVIVPVAAGGGTDLLARLTGQMVGEILGQSVVIDNRLGGGGNIGAEIVMRSKPDGYTLLVTPGTIASNVAVYKKLPYELLKDFQPITLIGQTGVVLVVNPSLNVNSTKEFVDFAKAHPGELNFGSAGTGSPQHLHSEFFNQLAGIKTTHIPYKGQSQAMSDLVGGQINYMFSPLQNALPYIQQGKIKVLAQGSAVRSKSLPNVPTLGELGYKDVDLQNWFAVLAPAGTPAPVIKKLSEAFLKAGQSKELKKKFSDLGFEAFFTTPEKTSDFMRAELVRWARVAAYAGIQAE